MQKATKTLFAGINHLSFLEQEDSGQPSILPTNMQVISSPAEEPDLLICVDVDRSALRLARLMQSKSIRTVLVVSEPTVVVPLNSCPKALKFFDAVLEVGRPGRRPLLPWPQPPIVEPATIMKSNSGKAILIQSRKYSFVKGQLYSLRVRLAASDKRIFVVGRGWSESVYKTSARLFIELFRAMRSGVAIDWQTFLTGYKKPLNSLGPAESKRTAMEEFKVAVVIENSQEYMSEKLFDAFVSGSIPVYVGPDLTDFGIPSTLYVRVDANLDSLKQGISAALGMDYAKWQGRVKSFLADEATVQFWNSSDARRRILNAAMSKVL